MRRLIIAALLGLSVTAIDTPASAQSSCSAFQTMCAKRCVAREPDDPDCTSDHCTPKLKECRSTGCWQEGQLYGGKLTCNLKKS